MQRGGGPVKFAVHSGDIAGRHRASRERKMGRNVLSHAAQCEPLRSTSEKCAWGWPLQMSWVFWLIQDHFSADLTWVG